MFPIFRAEIFCVGPLIDEIMPHGTTTLKPKGVRRRGEPTNTYANSARKSPTPNVVVLSLLFSLSCSISISSVSLTPRAGCPFIHPLPLPSRFSLLELFSSACVVGLLPKITSTRTTHIYTWFFRWPVKTLPTPSSFLPRAAPSSDNVSNSTIPTYTQLGPTRGGAEYPAPPPSPASPRQRRLIDLSKGARATQKRGGLEGKRRPAFALHPRDPYIHVSVLSLSSLLLSLCTPPALEQGPEGLGHEIRKPAGGKAGALLFPPMVHKPRTNERACGGRRGAAENTRPRRVHGVHTLSTDKKPEAYKNLHPSSHR